MSKLPIMFALWAAASGALIPVMAAMNGRLGKTIDNAPYSILVPFFVGLIGACLYVVATRASLPSLSLIAKTPPIYFTGGLIILFYVISVTYLTPHFGVANTVFFVVVAQIISATMIDHFGLFGTPVQILDARRAVGVALLFAGVILARSPSTGPIS